MVLPGTQPAAECIDNFEHPFAGKTQAFKVLGKEPKEAP